MRSKTARTTTPTSAQGAAARSGEEVFFELALADLTRAADLFQPIFARTDGVDGWVSLEVSPLLAHDTDSTLPRPRRLHARGGKPNLFIKIPGTAEGLPAIEEAIFAGIPVNVTLLFSREQYVAAADAYLRGVERRIEAGLDPAVASVASLFVSRWDVAVAGRSRASWPTGSASRSPSAPIRPIGSAGLAALAARRQCRRTAAAPAVGQHRHQGPEGLRHPLREGSRRALHGQHHAGGHPQGLRRPRRDRREAARGRRRLRDRAGRASPRRVSISTRWPPGSRMRAPTPSSRPGTS